MEYTQKERILLANLYEIRKLLDKDEENKKILEEQIEILKNGYELLYTDIERWSWENKPLSKEECSEVWDILNMYCAFERVYDKKGETPDHFFAKFRGFYWNEEWRQTNFAKFLLKKQENLSSVAQHLEDFDYHEGPFLPFYRLMLKSWEKYHRNGIPITNEDILGIIKQAKKEMSQKEQKL